eukprot:12915408-Prorocentrum_lima.AAC.1
MPDGPGAVRRANLTPLSSGVSSCNPSVASAKGRGRRGGDAASSGRLGGSSRCAHVCCSVAV